jgi:diazepam-binding inhibitor (GABA receptor modulator, acyl-CoA-binding protein)
MNQAFEDAVAKSKTLTEKPSNEVLLKLYGLYKQSTEGDVVGERPGGFDFKGAAKYDAWAACKGINQEDAAKAYIDFVNSLF